MAPSAAWASPVSGPGLNFENILGYFSHNIKRMCHEKFQGPTTFLLGCREGPKIGESIFSIKGQTVQVMRRWRLRGKGRSQRSLLF
jgi:hypothetical protein